MKQTKILTVLGVLLAMGITACGAKSNQGGGSSGGESKHTHSWGDWSEVKAPTCTEAGSKERTCECGEKDTQPVAALGHDFKDGDAYIQEGVKYQECSRCFKGILEWDAKNYDKDATVIDTSTTNGVKFTGNPTVANDTNDGIVERSYVTYKIQTARAAAHVGLDFELTPSSHNVAIFETIENDEKPGKDLDAEGNIITSTHRYALYVNGARVQLGKGPDASTEKAWYTWPVDFALKKGENVIKLVCMGGYRGVMHNFRLTNIPHYEHKADYAAKVSEEAAGEGYIATETYACTTNCGKTAIRWKAVDYDQTKTAARSGEGKGPESRGTTEKPAIRFSDEVQYKAAQDETTSEWVPDQTKKGCHIVYNVKTPELKNVGLALYSAARTDVQTVFDKVEGDTAKGYEMIDGELKRPDSRYGLKIDGQVYLLEADGQTWNGENWYDMPIRIPALSAGIHEIEIYNFGGYRADIYGFQLTSCPGTPFALDNVTWSSDDNGHWKELTDYAGVKFVYEEHTWVYGNVTVDSEDPTKASQAVTCSVCGKSSTKTGGVCGTFKWSVALQGAGSVGSDGKVNAGDNDLLVFNVPAAGTYVVTLNMQGSNNNGSRTLNGTGQGYAISANGVAGTFLGNGKTYEEFFGSNQTTWVDVAFGEVELVAGKNEIKVTALNGNYRTKINAAGNVTVAAKAAA